MRFHIYVNEGSDVVVEKATFSVEIPMSMLVSTYFCAQLVESCGASHAGLSATAQAWLRGGRLQRASRCEHLWSYSYAV